MKLLRNTWWAPSPANPVLPPMESNAFDSGCCMNPWIVRTEDEYRLYYGGGDQHMQRSICLATAPVVRAQDGSTEPGAWLRHGTILDHGEPGSFDERWCVLPHVVRNDDGRWFLYYTGNNGRGEALSQFPGLGVAISEDGKTFRKYEANPIIERSGKEGGPDALGIGGGSVVQVKLPGGKKEWRYYYTGCPTIGADLFLHQQKTICLATSSDGLQWEKQGVVMLRRAEVDYENVAVAAPVVHQNADGTYRMWYSAIGTRWGAYSICYAESEDGLLWNRGTHYGDNLQLGPSWQRAEWEGQMVEYPSVIDEGDDKWRMYYCGNVYGRTGIGTAINTPLRATSDVHGAHIVETCTGDSWRLLAPRQLLVGGVGVWAAEEASLVWHGPDADGTIWHESVAENGLEIRTRVAHLAEGLELTLTVHNPHAQRLVAVQLPIEVQCLGANTALPLEVVWEKSQDEPTGSSDEFFGDIAGGGTVTRIVRLGVERVTR